MGANDISWAALALGSLIMLIPLSVFYYYRTDLLKPTLTAFGRMAGQLLLVGIYLKYIFEIDSGWINSGWALLMIVAAGFSIVKRSDLTLKKMLIPVLAGVSANVLINSIIFDFIIIGSDNYFNARYLIPIAGMIIGNSLSSAVIAMRSFYNTLLKEEEKFRFLIMCGAERNEALRGFMSKSLTDAFSPTIASTATIGLIWLPGMMTGQILGGSEPVTAIKYQIMIIIAIFAGSAITVFISLLLSKRFAFDEFDVLSKDIASCKK